jgi:5-bromo-4-chloroindolyl phosphate hydrolysis protein
LTAVFEWLQSNRALVSAAGFALLLPALALVGDVGFPIAIGLSGLTGLGAYLALSRKGPDIELDSKVLDAGQRETARQILSDAMSDVYRLQVAGKRIAAASVRDQVAHLTQLFNATIDQVRREPERLSSVRRLLTFYAPRAADIAEGYATIEKSARPDPARLQRAAASLQKLEQAWAQFADKLTEPDRTNLDIELDLLDQSLKSDAETIAWR